MAGFLNGPASTDLRRSLRAQDVPRLGLPCRARFTLLSAAVSSHSRYQPVNFTAPAQAPADLISCNGAAGLKHFGCFVRSHSE
jgi:hypothetical protein